MPTHRASTALGLTLAAGLATVYASQGGQAWPPPLQKMPAESPVLSPAESMKTFVLPPGYRLELVASEPMIQEPVAIDWDASGRLWVIEMPGYMEDMPATTELQPTGRISVLEDTNDDGKMDKKTVFLDGLVLPRALKVLERGVLDRGAAEPLAGARHQRRPERGHEGAGHRHLRSGARPTSSTTRTRCCGRSTTGCTRRKAPRCCG